MDSARHALERVWVLTLLTYMPKMLMKTLLSPFGEGQIEPSRPG
jgi:hypothetical protein